MKLKPDTDSYMQLCLHLDRGPLYLKVPTYYDSGRKHWIGFIHLPLAKRLIMGSGKDSKELEQNFTENLKQAFEEDKFDEVFKLFQPLSYWDEND